MEAIVIGATLLGSFFTALALQRAALAALFRFISPNRARR
jgi:hypothetical protein